MRGAQHALESHAEPLRDRLTPLVARVDMPFHPAHPTHPDRPVGEVVGSSRDQPTALGFRHEPDAELTDPVLGVELREYGAADQPVVPPDAVEVPGVAGVVTSEALKKITSAGDVGNGMRERYPRREVRTGMINRGCELLGMPRLELSQFGTVTERIREHCASPSIRLLLLYGLAVVCRIRGRYVDRGRPVRKSAWDDPRRSRHFPLNQSVDRPNLA